MEDIEDKKSIKSKSLSYDPELAKKITKEGQKAVKDLLKKMNELYKVTKTKECFDCIILSESISKLMFK